MAHSVGKSISIAWRLSTKFASTTGRFMTPDWAAKPTAVPYAVFGDPQTLNLYTYVQNSPLNRIDADGHGDQQSSTVSFGTCLGKTNCYPASPGSDSEMAAKHDDAAQNQTLAQQLANQGVGEAANINSTKVLGGLGMGVVNSTTQSTTSKDGVETTTTTVTVAVYLNGKFDSAATRTTVSVFDSNAMSGPQYSGSSSTQSLNYGQAARALGANTLAAAQAGSLPSLGYHFARALGSDIYHHPIRYAAHAAGFALPFLGLGSEIEGLITAGEALHAAGDLNHEMQGGNQ